MRRILDLIYRLLAWLYPPKPAPPAPIEPDLPPEPPELPSPPLEPVEPPTEAPSRATLENLCLGIKHHEGWILPGGKDWKGKVYPRGSRSYQNNSPGNVRYFYGGYLAIYEPVGKDADDFARFKDYGTGWLYLTRMVRGMVKNNPNWTLLHFFEKYAPKEDNNDPKRYAEVVGERLGVDISFKVGNLVLT